MYPKQTTQIRHLRGYLAVSIVGKWSGREDLNLRPPAPEVRFAPFHYGPAEAVRTRLSVSPEGIPNGRSGGSVMARCPKGRYRNADFMGFQRKIK
jgi:hypothetical protein